MEKTQLIKTYKNSYFGSISFFVFVILLSIWLFFYNNELEKNSKMLQTSITKYTKSIDSYELNKEFKVYSLIQVNKKNLNVLNKNSQINKFLDHMDYIENTYNLEFRGFNLNNWLIWTSIIINTDDYNQIDYKLAYQKLVNFIWEYRKDPKAIFDLDFVNKISGHDQMKFDINFIIK